MNVYDAAHTLSKAIKNSEEYKEFNERQKNVYSNEQTKEMFEDFRKKAMEIQMENMSGNKVSEEKMKEVKKLEEIVMSNSDINKFFKAEMRFTQMMNDVYKIMGESINVNS
ncbi:MAG: YlbF family regulator [Firmicutes bacterium]|nr:YlbF family regulator [Bacillota bacterium]